MSRQDVKRLLGIAANEQSEWPARIQALNDISLILEVEAGKYEEVAGDVAVNLRPQQPIGALLAAVREEADIYDDIYENWIHDHQASLEQTVAAMRFFLASLTQYQSPLTEEDFVARLQQWSTTEVQKAHDRRGDDSVSGVPDPCLLEARRVFSTGLFAIALTKTEVCVEAVRSGVAVHMAQDFARAAAETSGQDSGMLQATTVPSSPVLAQCGSAKCVSLEEHAAPSSQVSCLDWRRLRARRHRYVVQCLTSLGEYLESLAPVLAADGIAVMLRLMAAWRHRPCLLPDLLRLLTSLLAHRRFAELFVDAGGLQQLLALQSNKHTYAGFSYALFGLASIPVAFERVCTLPSHVMDELVGRALSLFICGYDPARKNASLFFGAAIHFRAVLAVFDRCQGLRRLVDSLRTMLHLLRASTSESRTEKQVAFHASGALRQYFRTHLVLHVAALKRRQLNQASHKQGTSMPERQVDVTAEAVDAAISAIENDRRLAEAFMREKWAPMDAFLQCEGPALMLDFVQHTPGERYCNDIARHALEVLQIATLVPECRRALLTATEPAAASIGQTAGIAAVLEAAHGQTYLNDGEVMQPALVVIANCVTVPPSLSHLLPPPDRAQGRLRASKPERPALLTTPLPSEIIADDLQPASSSEGDLVVAEMQAGYARARKLARKACGIRMLLSLLHARSSMPAGMVDRLRTLAVKCLLGLAHDPALRHILVKLQVWRLLAQLVHEPDKGTLGSTAASRRRFSADAPSATSSLPTFNSLAMELINLTSAGLGRADAAAAASDAITPALHKIERAAIAASTQITYPASELLVLIEDHLRASGLHSSADALAAEAGLGSRRAAAANTSSSAPGREAEPWQTAQLQMVISTPANAIRNLAPSLAAQSGLLPSAAKRRSLAIAPCLMKSISRTGPAPEDALQQGCQQSCSTTAAIAEPLDQSGAQPLLACIPASEEAVAGDCSTPAARQQQTSARKRRRGSTEMQVHPSSQRRRGVQAAAGAQNRQQAGASWGAAGSEPCQHNTDSTAATTPMLAKRSAAAAAAQRITSQGSRLLTQRSFSEDEAANPLLLDLPRRGAQQPAAGCSSPTTPSLCKSTLKQAIASPPDRKGALAGSALGGISDAPVPSKLSSIVLQYLRHQHKAACLKAAAPISTLPPMSLLRPNTLPQAKRTLEAPSQVHRLLLRRSAHGPHGGWGGRRQERQFVYSRFRHVRSVRDEESAVYRSCTFLGNFGALALGTHSGEIRLHDTLSGDLMDTIDAHDTPAYQLRAFERSGRQLLLSSSRTEAKLWDVGAIHDRAMAAWSVDAATDPLHTFDGIRNAIFRPDGAMVVGVGTAGRAQEPVLFDLGSQTLSTINLQYDGWKSCGPESLCFNPTGELLLFGPTLWDPRAPRCLHVFDLLSYSACGSTFHPGGLEVVVNSEVWDLRTLKLQRSVPCLDSTCLTWSAKGDIAYATLRRASDDLGTLLNPKRAKHPLHTAFRTVDATDFSEISTVSTEGRCVLDLCVDGADNYIGVLTVEPSHMMSSAARIYEVGRRRVQDDDEDMEDGDADDDEEEEEEADSEEEDAGAQLIVGGPLGAASSDAEAEEDQDEDAEGAGGQSSDAELQGSSDDNEDGASSDGSSDEDDPDSGGEGDDGVDDDDDADADSYGDVSNDDGVVVVEAEWDEAELARHMRRLRRRRRDRLDDDAEMERFRDALLRSSAVLPEFLASESSGDRSGSDVEL